MTFHETLGVPQNATVKEIKAAYRKMAMQFHPDRNPGDAESTRKFLVVQEAYEALTNPDYKAPRYTQTYQTRPKPKPRSPNDWIRDAPPPTHDIWGDPIGNQPPKPKPVYRPRRATPKIEPEVDLWQSMETKSGKFNKSYWQEYDRLRLSMAYEDPDKFWEVLDEWVKKNR